MLIPQYNKGTKRKANQTYQNLMERARRQFKAGKKEAARKLRKQGQRLPSYDTQDPEYRRLKYIRSADDFRLAVIGPRSEAEEIKRHLRSFLSEELKLTLSEEKTLITHARSDAAKFLGYELMPLKKDIKHCLDKAGTDRRSINGWVGLRVPHAVILEKCDRYKKGGKPVHRAELLNESDFTIISTYQLEYRGIVEYYRLAYNLHSLDQLKWLMEQSLVKTLASKHKTSVRKIYKQYRTEIKVDERKYKVLQVTLLREEKKPLVATWGAIPLIWDIQANPDDRPHLTWRVRSELEKRLLAQVCEVCEATRMTEHIEIHHIRALKDLNKYEARKKPDWVKIMAARRRKTLVLGHTCHMDLHAGRPLRRKVSRPRTESLR